MHIVEKYDQVSRFMNASKDTIAHYWHTIAELRKLHFFKP